MPRTLIYEIFVDRFAGEGGRPLPPVPEDAKPWEHHTGGTLGGSAHRLDNIQSLGVDALYLTPIFTAPTNHKYDTTRFDEIDPRFGGEAAFSSLATSLHERGM